MKADFLQILFNIADCKIKLEKINVVLIVKLIEIKTKNNAAHNFGRVSDVIYNIVIQPPSFQRATLESSSSSALFVFSLYQNF